MKEQEREEAEEMKEETLKVRNGWVVEQEEEEAEEEIEVRTGVVKEKDQGLVIWRPLWESEETTVFQEDG